MTTTTTKTTATPLRLSEVRPGLQRAYLLVYTTSGTVTGARCRACMTNVDPTLDAMTWHACDDEGGDEWIDEAGAR